MAKITAAGDAARQFLAGVPELKQGGRKPISQWSDEYANRIEQGVRQQLAADLPVSRQPARGHILTPEHGPRGRPPLLPEPAENYKRPPALGASPAPTIVHTRPAIPAHVSFGEGGEVYTVYTAHEAMQRLRFIVDNSPSEHWGDPVALHVFDCSQNRWAEVKFTHAHGRGEYGIGSRALLEEAQDYPGGLEQYIIDLISARKSDVTLRLNHICMWQITVLPKPGAAQQRLHATLAQRRAARGG